MAGELVSSWMKIKKNLFEVKHQTQTIKVDMAFVWILYVLFKFLIKTTEKKNQKLK